MATHAILANRTGDRVHLADFDGVLRINPNTAQKYREAKESFPAHKIATRYQGGAEEGKFGVRRSKFGVRRSAFGASRRPLAPQTAFSCKVQRSRTGRRLLHRRPIVAELRTPN